MPINASATISVAIDFNGTASGYLVAKSAIVSTYESPFSEIGLIGPIKGTGPG